MRLDDLVLLAQNTALKGSSWRSQNPQIFSHVEKKQKEAKIRRKKQKMVRREEILKLLRERFTIDKNGECLAALHNDTIAKINDQKALDPVVFNEMFDPICLRPDTDEKLRLTRSLFLQFLTKSLHGYPPVDCTSKWFWLQVLTHRRVVAADGGLDEVYSLSLKIFKELLQEVFDNPGCTEVKTFLLTLMQYDFASLVLRAETAEQNASTTSPASRGITFNDVEDLHRFPLVLILVHRFTGASATFHGANNNVIYVLEEGKIALIYQKYSEFFCTRVPQRCIYAGLIGLCFEAQRFIANGGPLTDVVEVDLLSEKFDKSVAMIGSVIEDHTENAIEHFGILSRAGNVHWLGNLLCSPNES
ncbi:hypothetical protein AAVH_15637 [Aphelenchoides avenae]|nr:hypothetical protein AAVH_15637 [Aphelenchus avenae]